MHPSAAICSVLATATFFLASARAQDPPVSHLIVLDLSTSMKKPMSGGSGSLSRLAAAKTVLRDELGRIPPGDRLALRIFGFGEGDEACRASRLLVDFGTGNASAILETVEPLEATGEATPISTALEHAGADLAAISAGGKHLLFLSDGEETCEDRLADVLPGLKAQEVRIDAVGIGDDVPFSTLGELALEGGGRFFNGANLEALQGAFQQSLGIGPASAEGMPAVMTTTGLVRVRPADIGPEKGKVNPEDLRPGAGSGASSAGEASASRATTTAPGGTLEIIFDASNSMNAHMGGVPKIDLAKEALHHLLDALGGSRLRTGFRVFGHDTSIDREDRPRACKVSELVVPIGENSLPAIRRYFPGLRAWGRTPIAYSLEQAGTDLGDYLEASPMVLLISDGVESCDGDPVAVINQLQARGIQIQTHVVGFDLKAEERAALQAIAAAGGGNYYDARDYRELVEQLERFTEDVSGEPAPPAPPASPRFANPVQGGATLEEAVEIGPGRYTLWKHLEKGEHTFFRVPTTAAQRVALKIHIQSHSLVRDEEGNLVESSVNAGGGTQTWIYDAEGKPIKGRGSLLRGEIGEWHRSHFLDLTGAGTVFSIGDNYGPTPKDLIFEVTVQEAGDLYEGWDAPGDVKSDRLFAAPLNDPFYGHLGIDDDGDTYRVELGDDPPAQVDLAIRFAPEDPEAAFRVEIYHPETRRRLGRFIKLKGSADLQIPVPEDISTLLLRIQDDGVTLYHQMHSYHLELSLP